MANKFKALVERVLSAKDLEKAKSKAKEMVAAHRAQKDHSVPDAQYQLEQKVLQPDHQRQASPLKTRRGKGVVDE